MKNKIIKKISEFLDFISILSMVLCLLAGIIGSIVFIIDPTLINNSTVFIKVLLFYFVFGILIAIELNSKP